MHTPRPQPLNLHLARITPRWAFARSSRRLLAVAYYLVPGLWLSLGALLPSSLPWLAPLALAVPVLAPLALAVPVLALLWLMGATGARADLPETHLDERERQFRAEVYRNAFVLLMGLIALGYALLTLLEALGLKLPALEPQAMFALLFFVGFPLPTLVQAWLEPEPLRDE